MIDDRSRCRVPLYLCCAEDNEVALIQVIDELHREGFSPEVVSGLEADPSVLGLAVDRAKDEGLFVFCLTEELDRIAVRRLEGLFSARGGPHQRAITVPLNPRQPLAILPLIRRNLEALSNAEGSESPAEPPAEVSRMCDVVEPVDFAPPWDTQAIREGLARKFHREMTATAAKLGCRNTTVTPPEAPRPGRSHRVPVARGPIRAPREVVTSAVSSSSGVASPAGGSEMLHKRPKLRSAATPLPSPVERPQGSRGVLAAALAFLVGLGTMAVLGIHDRMDATHLAQASMTPPVPPELSPREPAARGAGAPAAPEAVSESAPTAQVVETTRPADRPLRDPEVSATGGKEDDGDAPRTHAPSPVADEPAPPEATLQRTAGLWVTRPSPRTLDWSGAKRYCQSQTSHGASRVRLAKADQLRQLHAALPAGTYWTRDAATRDDEAMAFDRASQRTLPRARDSSVARAICIKEEE